MSLGGVALTRVGVCKLDGGKRSEPPRGRRVVVFWGSCDQGSEETFREPVALHAVGDSGVLGEILSNVGDDDLRLLYRANVYDASAGQLVPNSR